ncbi:hypothetical protein SCHPADRAFT_53909 [Schizopora paradoxa]|uniref:Uncharacterized protein n=1 Tax=Schizopora paradoxa TaxID=27342 RepID=A0A0H2S5X8_9AGAM|nr:hypothetical protein SCHPADRAFT_53909 [Schizopora paradoxa]
MDAQSLLTIDTNDCDEGAWVPSISTNSTRSGLPGPGRNLDRFFSVVGGRLEKAANKAVGGKARLQTSQALVLSHGPFAQDADSKQFEARQAETIGESSVSTNATQSNLPGPGRNLDRLYSHLGRNLESFLSSLAQRTGWGPSAAERRVIRAFCHQPCKQLVGAHDLITLPTRDGFIAEEDWPKFERMSWKETKKIRKACKKLLYYTHSSSENNQILALRYILDLASIWPELHAVFRTESALCVLSTLPKLLASRFRGLSEYEELLTSSRRALFSIEENGLNNLAKKMVTADYSRIDHEEGWNWFEHYLLLSLTLLWDPDLAFLALRYLAHPFLLRIAGTQIDREKVAEFMGTMLIYALTQDSLIGKIELDVFARVLDETCLEKFVSWELMSKTIANRLNYMLLGR